MNILKCLFSQKQKNNNKKNKSTDVFVYIRVFLAAHKAALKSPDPAPVLNINHDR